MTYRAIFLDMDHTLCDTERADQFGVKDFQVKLAERIDPQIAFRVAEMYLKVIYGEKKGVPGWQKEDNETETHHRTKLLQKTIGLESDEALDWDELLSYANLFMKLRIKHFTFFPGTIEMLRRLRKKYKLILISNGPLFSQQPKIEKVGMEQHVDDIILGGALKHQKPHPSIFSLACEKAMCSPTEAIHVGDKLDSDIKGALNSCITSVWVNPSGGDCAPNPIPNYVINNIIDLEELLVQVAK